MEIRKYSQTNIKKPRKRDTNFNLNTNQNISDEASEVIDYLNSLPDNSATKFSTKQNTKAESKNENVHKDHRKRLKSQFIENGLNSLTDIQKLELLLFFSIPQKDTNPLSHRLIDEFGSLSGVFSTDYNRLMNVKGVKENTATLITLVKSLLTTISMPALKDYISGTGEAKRYCSKLYVGVEVEQFYVICLNKSNYIKSVKILKSGTADEIEVQIRSITEFALNHNCNRIIISHNHPFGFGAMSDEDCRFTYLLICSCILNSIEVLDHIIVGTDKTISLFEQHILPKLKEKAYNAIKLSEKKQTFLSSLSQNYEITE